MCVCVPVVGERRGAVFAWNRTRDRTLKEDDDVADGLCLGHERQGGRRSKGATLRWNFHREDPSRPIRRFLFYFSENSRYSRPTVVWTIITPRKSVHIHTVIHHRMTLNDHISIRLPYGYCRRCTNVCTRWRRRRFYVIVGRDRDTTVRGYNVYPAKRKRQMCFAATAGRMCVNKIQTLIRWKSAV